MEKHGTIRPCLVQSGLAKPYYQPTNAAPPRSMVRSNANGWSSRMQMGGQVHAITHLANRYGAARFLQGLDTLMKSPDFNPETDYDLPALSKMLVSLQGALQGRRAYLAGVLRKRLKNLRSHWLDQQVSESMARGVDIEQMIDLAKGVNSWDAWTEGLARLTPY